MDKKIIVFGIIIILLAIGLSGCTMEEQSELHKEYETLTVIIEAATHVENSKGEPTSGVEITFVFEVPERKYKVTEVRTTDSTGWTPFAVATLDVKVGSVASYTIYPTQRVDMVDKKEKSYSDLTKVMESPYIEPYYWSVNSKFVLD